MNFSIEEAVECVKTLVDNCRCVSCDSLQESRLRYPCGHSVCKECIDIYSICVLCSPKYNEDPVIDQPQTERAQHAFELLHTFQSLFDLDVYRKKRISEKLKTEKELFPECIQAPIKYSNKRKSSIFVDKENIRPSILPGENISVSENLKMEKSKMYVQEWLKQNENNFKNNKAIRRPLSDLSINTSNTLNVNTKLKLTSRKRKVDNFGSNYNNCNAKKKCKDLSVCSMQKMKCKNHESGIEIDDNISVITDSQIEAIEKDRLALMAVEEADKNESLIDADIVFNEKALPKSDFQHLSTSIYKVPFYKKSRLLELCQLCRNVDGYSHKTETKAKDVTVKIDTKSFVTTIKISENHAKKPGKLKTTGVQTESLYSQELNEASSSYKENLLQINKSISDDNAHRPKCTVIEDSDSDFSLDSDSKEIEIKADVHQSSEFKDYIFKPLEYHEYENRVVRKVRGNTPASSDSSDKENYDPNKMKQSNASKKKQRNKKF